MRVQNLALDGAGSIRSKWDIQFDDDRLRKKE